MTTVAAQLSRILSDYLADESRVCTFLPFILEAITNNNLLTDDAKNDDDAIVKRKWTVRLNALLGSKQATTRWAAISLIKETCDQSESLYASGVQSWAAQLLGILAKPESTMNITASIETLSVLFEKTIGKTELHAEVTSKSLPRFNQLLLTLGRNPELIPVTLVALSKNMELFPSMSRHITDQTLKMYISCLDGTTDVSPNLIGRCLAASCRTSTKTNFASNWQEMLMRLVGSVHEALDRLFDTVDEEDNVPDRVAGYPLSSIAPDYVEAFPTLLKRIRYIQDTIAVYLTSKTMVPVGVPIAHLTRLCCRIYNVYQGCVMREFKPKDEYACLMTCLPALHLGTNKLLASLLLCADAGMAQYGKLLARILLRLLSENSKKRAVKISVYNLISLCLRKFGYAFADTILKAVISSAIDDLKAIERKKLDVVVPEKKVAGKKRRAEHISSDAFTNADSISYQPCDIQMAALEVLQDLLTLHGNSMDANLRSSIDTIVVSRILQAAYLGDSNEESSAVKCCLYKCLLSSIMSPNTNQASLLPHAVRIFSAGQNDETHELRVICTQGLAICDLCMHTRMPPIQRATPAPPPPVQQATSTTTSTTVTSFFLEEEKEDQEEQVEKLSEQVEQPASPVQKAAPITKSPVVSRSNVIRVPEEDEDDDDDITMMQNQHPNSNSSASATTIPSASRDEEEKSNQEPPVVAPVFSSLTSSLSATDGDNSDKVVTSFTAESFSDTSTSSTQPPKQTNGKNKGTTTMEEDESNDEEFEIPEISMED
ncbi:rRNA processing/ribosome biogenesis-domain-containing protein [Zychaea mexicana]|uniref:rRNA processing/ribosome biogenesis-domain-containing protein n=1 Tax=Zychaea mexicana TaxID=64656 RepID=UPI0022FE1204|nr:rRNA processing/ribosome biogenesis-domain-containing protein [Zychaea mexicana]KAI9496069.1 rRNA processing/ribosome biogenesis-domain-containing protein [Zychaea mexicana]